MNLQLADLSEKKRALQRTLAAQMREKEEVERSIETSETEFQRLRSEVARLQANRERKEARLAVLSQDEASVVEATKRLFEEVSQLEVQKAERWEKVKQSRRHKKELDAGIDNLSEQLSELRILISQNETMRQKYRIELEELQKVCFRLWNCFACSRYYLFCVFFLELLYLHGCVLAVWIPLNIVQSKIKHRRQPVLLLKRGV